MILFVLSNKINNKLEIASEVERNSEKAVDQTIQAQNYESECQRLSVELILNLKF